MNTILFVNACIRGQEESRTYQLAQAYLKEYDNQHTGSRIKELELEYMELEAVGKQLVTKRERLSREGVFTDPIFDLAKEFAQADLVVIAAPHWDLSFPAKLKIYLEHICVAGITFRYTEQGSVGMAVAEKVIYITTRGGDYGSLEENLDLGYVYIKYLGEMLGITECEMLSAQGLDMIENDSDAILKDALIRAEKLAKYSTKE